MTTALPPILAAAQRQGFKVFTPDEAYDVNVIGIRTPGRTADAFDDLMTVTCRTRDGGPFITWQWPVTTDPGLRALQQRKHPRGVAILCHGIQFRSVYMIDKHAGKYDALCQRNGKVKVWRDNDGNDQLDISGQIFDDARGINIHASDSNPYDQWDKSRSKVGLWSEGCQVFQHSQDFREFMDIIRESTSRWGPRVSYGVLDARTLVGY